MRHDIAACLPAYPATSSFRVLCSELSDTEYGAFYSKKKAMADKAVSRVLCPECGGELVKHDTWLSQNGKYVCVATCSEHGEFVSRVKLNKHLDGKFYVNKVTRKEGEQVRAAIKEKMCCAKVNTKRKKPKKVKVV